jgi:hypothetical protein
MKRPFLLSVLLSFSLLSCDKGDLDHKGPSLSLADSLEVSVSAGNLTIGAYVKDITELSVTFSGAVARGSSCTARSYGIMYTSIENDSLTINNTLKLLAKELDPNGYFSYPMGNFIPGQGYLWTVFVEIEGEFVLGEVKTFASLSLVPPAVEKIIDVFYDEVTFKGYITAPSKASNDLVYGIMYSKDRQSLENHAGDRHEINDLDIKKQGVFTSRLLGLKPDTEYYYQPYIRMEKQTVYGEMGDFRTDSI